MDIEALKNDIQPLDPRFQLKLPTYEGPLDLLLFLIQKHELDILELPIAFITEKYAEYIVMMEQLNLDVASEYLVMAATLVWIKSKTLLPLEESAESQEQLEEEGDPRAELIKRLLEYQKYKLAAEQFVNREWSGRDVFARGATPEEATGTPPLATFGVVRLLDAFQEILKRSQKEISFEVSHEGMSIHEKINSIVQMFASVKKQKFEDLFTVGAPVHDLIVTFLAILEMAKRRLIAIEQEGNLGSITVSSNINDDNVAELEQQMKDMEEYA